MADFRRAGIEAFGAVGVTTYYVRPSQREAFFTALQKSIDTILEENESKKGPDLSPGQPKAAIEKEAKKEPKLDKVAVEMGLIQAPRRHQLPVLLGHGFQHVARRAADCQDLRRGGR